MDKRNPLAQALDVPQWMINAVPKLMEIDKMNERQIARLLRTGTMAVRLANRRARFEKRRFMSTDY